MQLLSGWSASERRGTGAAFATGCLAFLAWVFPNMTRIFTIPGAIICAALTVYFFLPEIRSLWTHSPLLIRAADGRPRGWIGILLLAVVMGGTYVAMTWKHPGFKARLPRHAFALHEPAAPIPPTATRQYQSKFAKMIYVCDLPQPKIKPSPEDLNEEFNKYADLMQNILGVAVSHTEIPYGVRLEYIPSDANVLVYSKIVMDIKRYDPQQVYVTVIPEMNGVFGLLLMLATVSPDDQQVKTLTANIERMVGIPEGKCKLI